MDKLLILLIVILILVVLGTAMMIANILKGLVPDKSLGGLLQQVVDLLKKSPKKVPSWVQFPNWERPSVDWKKYMDLLPKRGIHWGVFNWYGFRSGEMYVDGGTGAGEPNIAHPSLLIGPKNGPLGVGVAVGFTSCTDGHTTLMDVITPCYQAQPTGIVVTEVTIKGMRQAIVMAGPIQSAFGDAITDCIRAGFLPSDMDQLQQLCWMGQGFAYPFADNDERVYYNNYVAICMCIIKAVLGLPTVDELLTLEAGHPFRGNVLRSRAGQSEDSGNPVKRAPKAPTFVPVLPSEPEPVVAAPTAAAEAPPATPPTEAPKADE